MSDQDLNIAEAYAFYQNYILDAEKQRLQREYNFNVTGGVSSQDWELFVAILVKDTGKEGYGADLEKHEVKSARIGGSFEYQYHRNHGEEKLREDMGIEYHVFISYSPGYDDVVVRRVPGSDLASIFQSWLPGLIENYAEDNPKQRYRKSITFNTVVQKGEVIMEIKNGQLLSL